MGIYNSDIAKVSRMADQKLSEDTRRHLDDISKRDRLSNTENERVESSKRIEVIRPQTCDGCGATPELGMGEIFYIRDGKMLCESCEQAEIAREEEGGVGLKIRKEDKFRQAPKQS